MNACLKTAARIAGLAPKLCALAGEAVTASSARAAEIARQRAPVDSGELRSSISARSSGLNAGVLATAPHAAMVEYGTARMAPRPYMLPAARDVQAGFARAASDALRTALR